MDTPTATFTVKGHVVTVTEDSVQCPSAPSVATLAEGWLQAQLALEGYAPSGYLWVVSGLCKTLDGTDLVLPEEDPVPPDEVRVY